MWPRTEGGADTLSPCGGFVKSNYGSGGGVESTIHSTGWTAS